MLLYTCTCTGHDNWPLWEIATSSALGVVIAIVIAVVTLTFYIYRKTHGGNYS